MAAKPLRYVALGSSQTPHLLRKEPALGHEHASKRDERVLLRLIEARVQGLRRLDHLVKTCFALRETLRLRGQAIHRRQVVRLAPFAGRASAPWRRP